MRLGGEVSAAMFRARSTEKQQLISVEDELNASYRSERKEQQSLPSAAAVRPSYVAYERSSFAFTIDRTDRERRPSLVITSRATANTP